MALLNWFFKWFFEFFLGPPFPEEGDTVRVKDTQEVGTVMEVERHGCGRHESFATCWIRFANGTKRNLDEREFTILNRDF